MDEKDITRLVTAITKSVLSKSEIKMTLPLAKKLIQGVRKKADEMGVKAVVAVYNEGARPVAVECMDDSFIASFDIALNKAYTSVSLKMSTKELKPLSQPGGSLYGIQFTNNNKIVVFGGGVPLECAGKIIGGLGVSGGTEEQDTYLADFGGRLFKEECECMLKSM